MKFDHIEAVDIVARKLEKYEIDVQVTHDRGMDIDIIASLSNETVLKVIVRYVSPTSLYTFVSQANFDVNDNQLFIAALYDTGPATREVFLLPASNWRQRLEHFMTRDYDKPGQKSKPEYGITFSGKTLEDISSYRLPLFLNRMIKDANK